MREQVFVVHLCIFRQCGDSTLEQPTITSCLFQTIIQNSAYCSTLFYVTYCGSTGRFRTPDARWYIHMVMVQLILLQQWKQAFSFSYCCLGKCSKEVQLRISFGLVCCHVPLAVNFFFIFQVTNAAGRCLNTIISPVHNKSRLWDAPARQSD